MFGKQNFRHSHDDKLGTICNHEIKKLHYNFPYTIFSIFFIQIFLIVPKYFKSL